MTFPHQPPNGGGIVLPLEARRRASEHEPRNVDTRPTVIVGTNVEQTVDEGIAALAHDPNIYQADGSLVRVVRTIEPDDVVAVGTPQLRRCTAATLLERLAAAAIWQKRDSRSHSGVRQCLPPSTVVQATLDRGAWPGIKAFGGFAEAPTLRRDGSIIQVPGYDQTSGIVYLPSCDFPAIPESPTQADAFVARIELEDVFCDFPYADESHRSATIASLLTLLARPAIAGSVPAFVFDASTRGSGKTLQADAVSVIATGRAASKMSYPPDAAELEKVLGAYALASASIVLFDNVVGAFGGGPLDRVLTAGERVELRVLGKSEIPSLRWRAVVMSTGNNVDLAGDTARRVLRSRLESPLENPEERAVFKHPHLLAHVARQRPRLVRAALIILRAYIAAGLPRTDVRQWGSFEAWSSLVPAALRWAGAADPMLARPVASGDEGAEKGSLRTLLEGWNRLDPDARGLTAKQAIAALYPAERVRPSPHGPPLAPDGFDDLRDAIEALVPTPNGQAPNAVKLGYQLRKFKHRVVGALTFDMTLDRMGAARWIVKSTIAKASS